MNPGISSSRESISITCRCVFAIRVVSKSVSKERADESRPMKGLSRISTSGWFINALTNWNLRNSPLESNTMCLSRSVSIPNKEKSRSLQASSFASGKSSPTKGVVSMSCEFQRC